MAKRSLLAAAALVGLAAFASGSAARAGTIPYPGPPGTVNLAIYNFTAATTGDIVGAFFGFNAADADEIDMLVNGVVSPAGIGFPNQTSVVGSTFDFGAVHAGDTITFVLHNMTTGTDISSVPSLNGDGVQHIYSTDFGGNGTIPAGTYVAFEDLLASQGSDFDYNDDSFVFFNLATTSSTPIPGALPLFASGIGLVGVLALRRKRKKPAT